MSEEDDASKTEDPTDKKLSKAREKGQVAQSQEIKSWGVIFGGLIGLIFIFPGMMRDVMALARPFIESPEAIVIDADKFRALFYDVIIKFGIILAPIIGLLMVLIWSFHIQYGQPPSFYLKVPTMLYVFIFISMRALRFEPSYILLSGAAAAVGWLVLVLYAIFAVPGNPMITMNFVKYLTSNSILVGAEVDKIMVIILVTLLIALAVTRARRLMVRSVADAIAAHDLSRFVAPEIADRITSADRDIQPGDSEVGVATIMFTDIEGFSTISERIGPKNLVRALNDYFSAMNEIIRRYGGVISQFQGDAMLISFNTVRTNEKHALNAVRTAIDIQKACTAMTFGDGVVFKTRCGINTGEVIFGAIGGAGRLLFTVHGDQVNVAARLEPLNKEYGTYVMASERTVEEAGDDFGFVKVGEVTVRGRAAPTVVYAIRP